MRLLVMFGCLACTAFASEYAVLASGSRVHIDRHEIIGDKVRIYFLDDGFAEMKAADVRGYEAEEYVAPKPAPAVVAPVVPAAAISLAPPKKPLSPQELADQAADKYGLPHWLVRGVMSAESGFQPHAVSPKGAIGLMQLMPATAVTLGVDPNDPMQNVEAGARYLRDLLQKYDGGLWHALAAYNAGPGAVEKYKGVPPYQETVRYINRIDNDRKKAVEAGGGSTN